MARKFTANASNIMNIGTDTLGLLMDGAAKIGMHCFVKLDTLSGATGNPTFLSGITSGGTSFMALSVNGSGQPRVVARSVVGDAAQIVLGTSRILGPGVWHSMGGLIDYENSLVWVYVNGRAEARLAATFANAAWTHGTTPGGGDAIGANNTTPSTNSQTDGYLSQVSIWKFPAGSPGLTANNFRDLATGKNAKQVQRGFLVSHIPLKNQTLAGPEYDEIGAIVGTITGSVPMGPDPVFTQRSIFLFSDTATDVNCTVGTLAMAGLSATVLTPTTVNCGVGAMALAGLSAEVILGVALLRRCPFLTTDTLGTKSYQLQEITGGAVANIGSAVTTGFSQSGNITNAWYAKIVMAPNASAGQVAAIAVFSNINGTGKDAIEVNRGATTTPASIVQCKLSKFLQSDVLGTAPAQTLTLGATTGLNISATAGGGTPFVSGDVGKWLFSGNGRGKIITFTSSTVVRIDIIDDFASTSIASGAWSFAQIGYIPYDINGVAGAHVTSGIYPVVGVLNKFVTQVTQTPDAFNEAQEWIEWDAA